MTATPQNVLLYTDGACSGNPGPGGYGVVLLKAQQRRELSGGYRLTTNNRMEMMAAIVGLTALESPSQVILYSDSKYLIDAVVKGWAKKWRANNWKRNAKEKAKNPDLWAQLLDLDARHQVTWTWVKGHSGNPENERCDRLAVQAARQANLLKDEVFEAGAS
ncbi:MAG: ribonuclease HI [Cyanobacteriota bacterium]|jgi:ribonuclease HI